MPARNRYPRFLCPSLPHPRLSEPRCTLDPEQTRHLRKVLRLREGDTIDLFNGQGLTATAQVLGFDEGFTFCRITEQDETPAPNPRLTIAAAIPKGGKADDMVATLSQAGADVLVPLLTQRSVVDPRDTKLDRLSKVAEESAKQCGRSWLMRIAPPVELGKVLHEPCDVGLVMDPDAPQIADLSERLRHAGHVIAVVGPEGGLTDEERRACENAGFLGWSIGPHILRIETAAALGTGLLRYLTTP